MTALAEASGAGLALAWPRRVRLLGPAACVALVLLQLALALTHLPWEDEAQAWNIAAWSRNFSDLMANLRYEGHPVLWYCVLRAAATVSAAPGMMNVVQACVSAGFLIVLLTRAPFPLWHRLALGASYLLLFEYGTIARSYGLGVLCLLGFLTFRTRPLGWVFLALMVQVSLHFMLLSAACIAAALWVERRWSWRGADLWLASFAFAAVTVWPEPGTAGINQPPIAWPFRVRLALGGLDGLLLPENPLDLPMRWAFEANGSGGVAGILALALVWLSLRRDLRVLAIGMGLAAATLAFSVLVYPTTLRHAGVIFLFVVAGDWIRQERTGEPPAPVSRAWAAWGAVLGLTMAVGALAYPFTTSRAVIAWIDRHGYGQAPLSAYPIHMTPLLSAESGRPLYDMTHRCMTRWTRWDGAPREVADHAELLRRAQEGAAAGGGTLLLLTNPEAALPDEPGVERLATFPPALSSGATVLHAIRAPASAAGMPACPWTRR